MQGVKQERRNAGSKGADEAIEVTMLNDSKASEKGIIGMEMNLSCSVECRERTAIGFCGINWHAKERSKEDENIEGRLGRKAVVEGWGFCVDFVQNSLNTLYPMVLV